MSKEQRKYPRKKIQIDVELILPSGVNLKVKASDMSEGGVFLQVARSDQPIIGEVVKVNIIKGQSDIDIRFPSNDAAVIRQDGDGIGLSFIEMDFGERYTF